MVKNRIGILGMMFIILFLVNCKNARYIPHVQHHEMLSIDQEIPQDTAITNYILPFKATLEAKMNEVIGQAPTAMIHNRNLPETELSNFFVDALLTIGRQTDPDVDFSLATKDAIRSSIAQGAVTVRTVFELMPFENYITILELRGSDVMKLADFIAKSNGQPIGNAHIEIQHQKTLGFQIDGKQVDPNATYKLVTYDFIANGGDLVSGLDQPLHRLDTDLRVRDALIAYIQELTQTGKQVKSAKDGRVRILQ